MRQHGSSSFLDALALSDMDTLTEAREAAVALLKSTDPEDRSFVRNVLETRAKMLNDIAIN